ncbi:hypothetical protein VNO77_19594 [Canavalia gladiata]|uniref:Uncharacterized protein n=1 Tax=Canavalia gladiata TaxID=3824 RepID=A0AAN9QIM7_CANGL
MSILVCTHSRERIGNRNFQEAYGRGLRMRLLKMILLQLTLLQRTTSFRMRYWPIHRSFNYSDLKLETGFQLCVALLAARGTAPQDTSAMNSSLDY